MRNTLSLTLLAWLPFCICATANAQSTSAKFVLSKELDSSLDRLLLRFPDSPESAERSNRYSVKQSVRLSQVPPNTEEIQLWISIPKDERDQRLLD
jgi:hypothetical protein